jgi:hypothetical protein
VRIHLHLSQYLRIEFEAAHPECRLLLGHLGQGLPKHEGVKNRDKRNGYCPRQWGAEPNEINELILCQFRHDTHPFLVAVRETIGHSTICTVDDTGSARMGNAWDSFPVVEMINNT